MLSAKSNERNLEESGRSFMYSKNRRGPSIEPCGTPSVISSSELDPFPTDTNC